MTIAEASLPTTPELQLTSLRAETSPIRPPERLATSNLHAELITVEIGSPLSPD